ncbi:unnamed protein product [Rotaria sp. Silwood1]|nr:unnamed protein product [Rotaria sp. Silwood1]CAF1665356.1 unnamed protein product [Rotaria sp. Silwood1]CAF3837393.1 unnamed protein product [Rotaria sp. Silwood1]CAF4018851.1 unnamed protein product [Rotaria sp. Silwood1]CAF4814568.1 unnamed protein product [Rotaria sp. Silwood1]
MSSTGQRFTDVELGNQRLPACYGYFTCKLVSLEEAMGDVGKYLPEINRFVKMAKKHCTYPNEHKLSKDEAAALYLYTMEMSDEATAYRLLNETLRAEDRSTVRPWFSYLKLLDSAAAKLPKFKGTVWRGVNKNVSHTFKKGQKITWWSVSSCSTSVDVISSFLSNAPQSTLFNIDCINGKSIAAYTCYPTEDEVILMPGTIFEVVSNPLHHHGGLHIIHLKELSDDDDDDEQESTASSTASASATASVAQKFSSMNLSKKKNLTKGISHMSKEIPNSLMLIVCAFRDFLQLVKCKVGTL